MVEEHIPEMYWESTYAIAMALIAQYPDANLEMVGLQEMAKMIESLPGFADDPSMVTERILLDIQIVWYEEASTL
ncbi:MAG: Fe-S cluster assembly protein IscX [Chloroflexi bacterium]|nr:Fe-S cluster assembly protein IscX [Chloroflexota bacterium]